MIKRLFRSFLRRFRYLPAALFLSWCLGQIFRDLYWLTGLCFYVPSVLVCLLLWGAIWFEATEARRKYATVLAVGSFIPLVFILFIENHFSIPGENRSSSLQAEIVSEQQAPGGKTFKLVHWNICKGRTGLDRVVEHLKTYDADMIALSEVPKDFDPDQIAAVFGDDFQVVQQFDLVLLVRGQVKLSSDLSFADAPPLKSKRLKIMRAVCELDQDKVLNLWMADLVSYLEVPRHPSLLVLNDKIKTHQPDLVVGDFNAPRRSLGLSNLPMGYQHAYDLKGSGWGYTFPVPVPVYAIDQCLVRDQVVVESYELDSTLLSDHRVQIVEFSIFGTK